MGWRRVVRTAGRSAEVKAVEMVPRMAGMTVVLWVLWMAGILASGTVGWLVDVMVQPLVAQ